MRVCTKRDKLRCSSWLSVVRVFGLGPPRKAKSEGCAAGCDAGTKFLVTGATAVPR